MNHKRTYIIWFIVLIAPAIISKIFYYAGYPLFNADEANILTIISKIGLIVLTIWYALKIHFNRHWAILLGISTILPFMTWISLIILLKKSGEKKLDSKEEKNEKGSNRIMFLILLFPLIILAGYLLYQLFDSTGISQNTKKETSSFSGENEDTTIRYEECIDECDKTRVCLEFEKRNAKFVPGGPPPQCLKYSDTSQCRAICISKYK